MPASTHYTVAITIPEQSDLHAPTSLLPPACEGQPRLARRCAHLPVPAWFPALLVPVKSGGPCLLPPRTRRCREPSCALFAPVQRSWLALAAPPRLALLPPLSAL